MRVAVLSDIHGNLPALEAALADAESQAPDAVLCAGDVVNPLLESAACWESLRALGVPVVRGNHEDYVLAAFSAQPSIVQTSPRFRPIRLIAERLTAAIVPDFEALPDHLAVGDLYLCHGAPGSNRASFVWGVDDALAASLRRVSARAIVAGHAHEPWSGRWEDKRLVAVGSVGVPFRRPGHAEYALLDAAGGEWRVEHRFVPYDQPLALDLYREPAADGGPIGWLLYDEIWQGKRRLAPFFAQAASPREDTLDAWERAARAYLESLGRWDAIRAALRI